MILENQMNLGKKHLADIHKKDVFDAFFKSLDENKLENSCQWCVELNHIWIL